jgi:alkanesulfonate monooxygenase SsuD/methylene tetrahydromethanopterin reductase-like flavin-dependent oxidoreductase (luciferase family)
VSVLAFGIFDSLASNANPDAAVAYEELIASVQLAEEVGYHYYFLIEHQSSPYPGISSPNVFLASAARATKTIRLGAMVYQLPFHHPLRLAQDVATLDQLSRGRVDFGLGYGVAVEEFESWGLDFQQRRLQGVEAMHIIRRAWAERKFSFTGKYWNLTDVYVQPQPFQQPHPPVWMGGHSTESFDYAAEMDLDLAQNIDVEEIIAEKFAYFHAAWKRRGHARPKPRTMLVRHVHVAETDELALAESQVFMKQGLAGQRGVNIANSVRPDASPERKEIARIYSESTRGYEFWVGEGLAFVGSPDSVIRQIETQQRLIGYDVLLTHHRITTMPQELVTKSQRLFGEKVIPAFVGSSPETMQAAGSSLRRA